jgi:hypothetical protein
MSIVTFPIADGIVRNIKYIEKEKEGNISKNLSKHIIRNEYIKFINIKNFIANRIDIKLYI